jgi:hypothetical protein
MEKDNSLLFKGMLILGFGLLLSAYSISSYIEVKNFAKNVDFELVDGNIELSSEDKYYKYLTFADYINKKLNKNRNLPIKNSSCTYLNYAQHNAIELYQLTNLKMEGDAAKRNVASGNIRTLYDIIDSYSTCKAYPEYKTELKNILTEIEQTANSNIDTELRMQKFLNGYRDKDKQEEDTALQEENLTPEQNIEQREETPQVQTPIQEQ